MGSLESGTVLMDHQPAKGRKRRKSFIERTSTTTGRQEDVENVSRELRKRKASGTLYDTGVPNAPLHTLSSAQGLDTSPKKIRFEDEDYIEQGVDKGKEVHSEMVDLPARGARGRGRGRGSRGSRGGRGRGGRGGHRERDLESTPKTRYGSSSWILVRVSSVSHAMLTEHVNPKAATDVRIRKSFGWVVHLLLHTSTVGAVSYGISR